MSYPRSFWQTVSRPSHLRKTLFMVASTNLQLSDPDNPIFRFMDKKRAEVKHFYVYTVAGVAAMGHLWRSCLLLVSEQAPFKQAGKKTSSGWKNSIAPTAFPLFCLQRRFQRQVFQPGRRTLSGPGTPISHCFTPVGAGSSFGISWKNMPGILSTIRRLVL